MHFTDDETNAWKSQGSYLNTENTQPLSSGARMQPKFALLQSLPGWQLTEDGPRGGLDRNKGEPFKFKEANQDAQAAGGAKVITCLRTA